MAILKREDRAGIEEPTLEERLKALANRAPGEVDAARWDILQYARPARSLPDGFTLEELIVGRLRDEESETEIIAAIDELS